MSEGIIILRFWNFLGQPCSSKRSWLGLTTIIKNEKKYVVVANAFVYYAVALQQHAKHGLKIRCSRVVHKNDMCDSSGVEMQTTKGQRWTRHLGLKVLRTLGFMATSILLCVLTPDETRSKLSSKFYLQIIPDPTFFHKYVQFLARACSSEHFWLVELFGAFSTILSKTI